MPAVAASPTATLTQTSPQQQGRHLYQAGQFTEAVEVWTRTAQNLADQGDWLGQASVLSNLALAHQQLNNWEQSHQAITQSLDLLQALDPDASPATSGIFAQVWNTQGNLLLLRSQPTKALAAFKQATAYYRQAGDDLGTLQSQINQAQALESLGFYRQALTTLTAPSLALSEQPESSIKIAGLQLQGDLQRLIGDLAAATATLHQGLTIAQTLGSTDTMAALELSLGHTAQAQGDIETALAHYQRAAAAATSQLQLRAQLSQWSLLYGTDKAAAETLYQQIQTGLARLPMSRMTVNTRLELAHQQLTVAADRPRVKQELAIARQQAVTLDDARAESYALGYLGQLAVQENQWQDAGNLLQQALILADNIQAPDLAYQWQWHLGQLRREQGQIEPAITNYDLAVDNLQSLRTNLIAVSPDLRFNFREQVEPVYREWVDLLLTQSKSPTVDGQALLIKARQAIESLQLAELENFFQEPCVPISEEIDQVAANSPTAIFYPIILPDRLEIILKLPQQPLQQYTAQMSEIDLESLLEQFQDNLLKPYTLQTVKAEAKQLYDLLIHPTEDALKDSQIDTLVFVLDGFLRSIPMATLYDGQQYLVEKYSIALAPGLQLVNPQPLQRQELATIIAGLSEARSGFAALPFVKQEVDQIQKLTPSRVLLNESFTASNLAEEINNTPFPLVHLATHGQFSSDPQETFVLAWDDRIEMNALNRLLRQGEQTRQSAIELLILSACETAAGDKRAALGLAGIAVQAGARSTLASLWNLDDQSGAIFASLFYEELQTPGISKAQALRNAQLHLLRDYNAPNPIYEHPLYWAPYVLLGNWL